MFATVYFLLFLAALIGLIVQGSQNSRNKRILLFQQHTIQRMQEEINRLNGQRPGPPPAPPQPSYPVQPPYPARPSYSAPPYPAQPPVPAPAQPAASWTAPAPLAYSPPYAPPPPPPRPSPAEKVRSVGVENWVGRNLLGVAASVLVFIGLIFFGVLIYEYINDTIRIIIMYAVSALFTGVGIALTVRKRNPFTIALTGCGSGMFYISILLTHVFFGRLNDIAAFSLLLAWLVGSFVLAGRIRSTTLSVVAHIGMCVSLCFAYGAGLRDNKLLLLLVYQFASIAAVVLGNIFCSRKTYRFGLFASLGLTLVASAVMMGRFIGGPLYGDTAFPGSGLPAAAVAAAFAAQFVCASFLSYLLSTSTTRLKDEGARWGVHIGNKLLWVAALALNVLAVGEHLAYAAADSEPLLAAVAASAVAGIVILTVHAAVSILMSMKFGFDGGLETLSVLLSGGIAVVLLLRLWTAYPLEGIDGLRLPWLIVPAALFFAARRVSKNRAYDAAALAVLLMDALFMFVGYEELTRLGTVGLSVGYLALLLIMTWVIWSGMEPDWKTRSAVYVKTAAFAIAEFSMVSIFLTSGYDHSEAMLLIVLTMGAVALKLLKFDRVAGERSAAVHGLLRGNEWLLFVINLAAIAFMPKDALGTALYLILTALTLAMAFMRLRPILDGGHPALQVAEGVKLTLLTLAAVYGHTSLFNETYVISLICMVTALLCVIAGFVRQSGSLRLYGLVLTLVCVLKLVTYDVAGLDTILRVVSLIGGGIICFAISAIYSYSVKKLAAGEEPEQDGGA